MTDSTVRVLLHTLPEYEHTLHCALLDAGIDISSPVKAVDFFRSIGSSGRETDFTKLVNYPYTLEVFNHRSDVLPYQSVHLRYVDGKRQLTWVGVYPDLLDYAQVSLMSKDELKSWIEYCRRKYERPTLKGQGEEYKRYMLERCLEG